MTIVVPICVVCDESDGCSRTDVVAGIPGGSLVIFWNATALGIAGMVDCEPVTELVEAGASSKFISPVTRG